MLKKILKVIWLHGSIGAILLVGSQNSLAVAKKKYGTSEERNAPLIWEWNYWTAFKNFKESWRITKEGQGL